MKTCKICLKKKTLDQYSGQTDSRDSKRHQCKECELKRNREWRAKRKGQFDINKIDFKTLKKCSVCKEEKLSSEFYFDYTASSGLQTACKDCGRKNTSRWQRTGRYGLKPGEYEEMLISQGGTCGICKTVTPGLGPTGKPARWRIDHNHETNNVRGLLCSLCNTGLGMFKDSPEILQRAIKWITVS